jgi:hypothetical protein
MGVLASNPCIMSVAVSIVQSEMASVAEQIRIIAVIPGSMSLPPHVRSIKFWQEFIVLLNVAGSYSPKVVESAGVRYGANSTLTFPITANFGRPAVTSRISEMGQGGILSAGPGFDFPRP